MLALVWPMALAAAPPAPTCATSEPLAAWSARLDAAEAAFTALDEAGFDAAMAEAARRLECLDARLSPAQAGRWHRLVGLRRFVRHDEEGARLAFAAARAVDPFGALPTALLPPGHEARRLSDEASTPGVVVQAPLPRRGHLSFDGQISRARPADRPTVAQVDLGGQLRSAYLAPTDPLPDYPRAAPPAAHWALGGAGVLLGAAAVLCYSLAADEAAALEGELPAETSRSEVLGIQARANGLVIAAAAGGTVGLGLVGVSVARW